MNMQSYDGRQWWPQYQPPEPTPPLTNEPPPAVYELRYCTTVGCGAITNREACAKCQACKLAPVFGSLRERVRNGRLSDWPDQQWSHTEMQTIWLCGAPKWQAAHIIVAHILFRAGVRGFNRGLHKARAMFFHPNEFREDEAA